MFYEVVSEFVEMRHVFAIFNYIVTFFLTKLCFSFKESSTFMIKMSLLFHVEV
jgi:hypothetical protein